MSERADVGHAHGAKRGPVPKRNRRCHCVIALASALRRERRLAAARSDSRAGEVIGLWRRGVTREDISRRLGVTLEAIREIVAEHATPDDQAARKDACGGRQSASCRPRFSELELIDGLWLVSERLGRVPTGSEYDRAARELGLAAMPTVYARFGGWGPALITAGLVRSPRRSGGRVARWDTTACWEALLSVVDQLGEPPRYRRYAELAADRDDLPSGPTLTRRLGLWSTITAALNEQAAPAAAGHVRERIAA